MPPTRANVSAQPVRAAPGPGPRRGRVYELFILGELTAGHHHGYLLHTILCKILGPFWQISWGTLYPLIHRLSHEGLIAPVAEKPSSKTGGSGKSKQRILYRITPAGRQRFQRLMLEHVPYTAYDTDLFVSKLGYFDHINARQQQEILEYHRGFLLAQDDYMRASLRLVMGELDIPAQERERIQWVTEFRLGRIQTEMEWVEKALKPGG